MVPGMTERERLAADTRRLEWLADARFGPPTFAAPAKPNRAISLLALVRLGLAAALIFGRRVRALPGQESASPARAPASSR